MANQGNGSYSSSRSTSRKIRLNCGEMWRKQKASKGDARGIPVKSSLAEGLGRKVEVDKAPTNATVTPEKAAKSTGDFRVKTLEEIRQEKANRQGGTPAQLQAEGQCKTEEQSTETRPSQAVCTSAFSQALPLRKRRRSEDGKQNADELPTKRRVQGENSMQGVPTPSVAGQEKVEEPVHRVKPLEEIHIKTLDEIKREKALRLQQREESVSAPPAPPAPAPARRKSIRSPKLTVTPEKAAKSTGDFRVKTLEEIRQEKANRQGGTPAQLQAEGQCKTEEQSTETRPSQAVCTSAFSQALPLRKRRRSEDGKQNADELPTKRRVQGENSMQGVPTPSVAGQEKVEEPVHRVKPLEEIHIKTLDEIKREKALRLQQREESVSAPPAPPAPAPARRKSIRSPKLTAPAIEAETHVERSTSVPEAVCAAARKRKAAEMCGSAVSATADGTEEPPAKTAAVAAAPARPEDILVTVREAETPPNSPELHLGCWAESVAQAEHSSCASPPPEVTATTQQLCSSGAEKAPFAAEDDYETLMLELSGGDVEGGEDLELGMDVHELLQELSDVAQGCWAESVAQTEDSSSTSPSAQTAAKAQQLCSSRAEKVPFSADDYDDLMLKLSDGELEGEVDLELANNVDELLQDPSEMLLGCWAESVAQAEDSSSASPPPEVTATTQQLCSPAAGKTAFAAEDGYDDLMLELSGGDVEGGEDLELEMDVHELLQELSEVAQGCWAESVAQTEDSSSTSPSAQTAAKAQQLCSTGAEKVPFSAEDDYEQVMRELSDGELEGEVDLELANNVDELLQDPSEMPLGCWAESVAQAEDSSSASAAPEVTAKSQQLCSSGAEKAPSAAEDGYDDLMLELSDAELEGEEDLELETDVDELLQEPSEMPLGCRAESVAQAEDSSSASAAPEVTAKSQQLCSSGAGKVCFSAEDDWEKLMLELSGGDLQGGVDLEPGKDADELLQELSDMTESITH